jgi:ribonuclease HII
MVMSQSSFDFDAAPVEPDRPRTTSNRNQVQEKQTSHLVETADIAELITIGVDEVGRGCIAGPIGACAFMFVAPHTVVQGLRDSKKLTAKSRKRISIELQAAGLFCYAEASSQEIDELGINKANLLAMRRAIAGLALEDATKYRVVVDGTLMPPLEDFGFGDVRCIPQADDSVTAVSAASVIAKVRRDEFMAEAGMTYPGYGFESHSGYPTSAHIEAVEELGATPLHRMTFAPLPTLLSKSVRRTRRP